MDVKASWALNSTQQISGPMWTDEIHKHYGITETLPEQYAEMGFPLLINRTQHQRSKHQIDTGVAILSLSGGY